MRGIHVGAFLFVFATACGTVEPGECDDGRLEVGAGGSRIRALPAEGGELSIVRGAQGGIHLIVGFWLRELPLDLEARYWLEEDGATVGNETVLSLSPSLFAVDGARYVRHPDLIILDNEAPSVAEFVGRTVELRASATTADDAACDRRTVTIVDPEAP